MAASYYPCEYIYKLMTKQLLLFPFLLQVKIHPMITLSLLDSMMKAERRLILLKDLIDVSTFQFLLYDNPQCDCN